MDYNIRMNRILASLPSEEFAELVTDLEPVKAQVGQALFHYGDEVKYAFFPVTAVASLVYLLEDGKSIEVGMVGPESGIGLTTILGSHIADHTAEILIPGLVMKVRVEVLARHFGTGDFICQQLTLHMGLRHAQITRLAVCNLCHHIPERLSRWLLTLLDRTRTNEFQISHEQIAERLSIRRAGVTSQLGEFEKMGAIEAGRRRIKIIDREKLKRFSCECYRCLSEETTLIHNRRRGEGLGIVFPPPVAATFPLRIGT
jgi:CRP-like cAMP-binding protein